MRSFEANIWLAFQVLRTPCLRLHGRYVAMLFVPLYAGWKFVVSKFFGVTLESDLDGPAPPPPPVAPSWAEVAEASVFGYAEAHPVYYLALNFGIAFIIGTIFLFLKDITDWWVARQAAQRQAEMDKGKRSPTKPKYQMLADEADPSDIETGSSSKQTSKSPEELAKELRRVTDKAEELEIKVRVSKKSTKADAVEARAKLKTLVARRDELRGIVLGATKRRSSTMTEEPVVQVKKEQTLIQKIMGSAIMQIVMRSANGIMAVRFVSDALEIDGASARLSSGPAFDRCVAQPVFCRHDQ